MITVTFEAENISKLSEQMIDFLNSISVEDKINSQMELPLTQPVDAEIFDETDDEETEANKSSDEDGEVEAASKKRRGRKKAKTVEEIRLEQDEKKLKEPAIEITPNIAFVTHIPKERVHQALQKVNVEKGLTVARDILHSFGINRVSEIKPEQFEKFIEKCEAAIL